VKNQVAPQKTPYQVPRLEQYRIWSITTGVSLPIGTGVLGSPLEMQDFMKGEP
jgi:hypothetical protein